MVSKYPPPFKHDMTEFTDGNTQQFQGKRHTHVSLSLSSSLSLYTYNYLYFILFSFQNFVVVRGLPYHDMYYKGCGLLCAHKKFLTQQFQSEAWDLICMYIIVHALYIF